MKLSPWLLKSDKLVANNYSIIKLLPRHASQIANLHISGIITGFIGSLGTNFVQALYEAIAESKTSFGFVAERNSKVIGFVVFTSNLPSLYKSVVIRKGFCFAFLLAGKFLSLKRLKKVFETLFYPGRTKKMNLPSAELLSVVVADEERGKGLAAQLINQGLQECAKRGINKVKVLVAVENEAANTLYQKCGFELVTQIDSHGIPSNIYVANV